MDFLVFISGEWLLVSVLLVLVYLFFLTERIRGGKPISSHEVTRLLNSDSGILVDIRDAKDFNGGHIAGALNIPLARFTERMAELEKYRDKTIVVADKMGQHAGAVGKKLQQASYTARRLQGGMAEWSNQNLPLVRKK